MVMKYLELMKDILSGKKIGDEGSSITAITYAGFLNWIYKMLAVCSLLVAIGSFVYIFDNIKIQFSNLLMLLAISIVALICILFFFIFWAMSNEIKDETNKEKVLSELTAVATIIALVIAALSLRH